jgi:hypothetical protein
VLSALRRVLPALAATALLLGGCTGMGRAASAQGTDRTNVVSELAKQLAGSANLTYTAGYHLAGGGSASVSQAQNPHRAAYEYPGGRVLVTAAAITQCREKPPASCTMTTPPDTGTRAPDAVFTASRRSGLITPPTVLALLRTAAMDDAATLDLRDTTVAGHHATCVELAGLANERARAFTTCVTNDGVLGSFRGTVDGQSVDLAMTRIDFHVLGSAFGPPAVAKVIDRRAR